MMRMEALALSPPLAEAARKHFRTDAALLAAVAAGDVAALAEVPGVSTRRAIEVVRQARGLPTDETLLATAATRKVHDDILARLCSFAATTQGRQRLQLLGPLRDPDAAAAHAAQAMVHKEMAARLDRERVRRLLRRIKPLGDPAPRFEPTRLVVCASEEIQDRLARSGLHKWAALGTPRDLEEASGYDLVVFVGEAPDLDGLDNALEVPATAPPEAIVPDLLTEWVRANRDALEAMAELAAHLGRASRAAAVLDAQAAAPASTQGPLRPLVEEERVAMEGQLKARVTALSVSGADLLASWGRGLPPSIQKAIDDTLAEGSRRLAQRTGLHFQPFVAGTPIGIDDEEVDAAERGRAVTARLARHEAQARAARTIGAARRSLEAEVAAWQAFDAEFALGCFALHYDLLPARFAPALDVSASVHLALADRPDAQRIDYHLGREENVALLTGANSGGKTTLLEHLAQVVLMARMGLPVVGNATVPWVDEVHFVTARRHLDAGAFESFLRGFLPVALGQTRRLILADEVESVTELEAAGRILGFFLDRIAESESIAVVVSHMAPQILAHCHAPVRVDGIEATGLDDQNRLVVDRMPRLGTMARSTPELIIRRLAATARGPEQRLYLDLLGLFGTDAPAHAMLVQASRKGKRKGPSSAPS